MASPMRAPSFQLWLCRSEFSGFAGSAGGSGREADGDVLGGGDGSGGAEPEGPLLLADSTAAVRLAAAVALASAMRSSWAHSRSCWRSEPLLTVTVRDLNFRGHVSQRRRRLLWSGSSLNCFHSSFHSWGHSAIDCGLLEGPAGSGCEPWLGWLASSVMSAAVRLPANCARLSSSMAVSWKAGSAPSR